MLLLGSNPNHTHTNENQKENWYQVIFLHYVCLLVFLQYSFLVALNCSFKNVIRTAILIDHNATFQYNYIILGFLFGPR